MTERAERVQVATAKGAALDVAALVKGLRHGERSPRGGFYILAGIGVEPEPVLEQPCSMGKPALHSIWAAPVDKPCRALPFLLPAWCLRLNRLRFNHRAVRTSGTCPSASHVLPVVGSFLFRVFVWHLASELLKSLIGFI
jgi:hypothetical protein